MARLFEYQGKEILKRCKLAVPPGQVARSAAAAAEAARQLAAPVVIKGQIFATKRKEAGLIQFADTPQEAQQQAAAILGKKVGNFTVEAVLVEKKIAIAEEYYAGLIVDDAARSLRLILSNRGGIGIEEIAAQHPQSVQSHLLDFERGLRPFEVANLWRQLGLHGERQRGLTQATLALYQAARSVEARSAEINPLVITAAGEVLAADCRIAVDDYAVFRHPELKIEIARELDRPPTELERIAFKIEENDYRGTFYFIQMEQGFKKGDGVIGFHGAGGGGSMMSMDALLAQGFKIANFTDTSGNPPASKVYRAAKIILAQAHIDGYFGSGSGLASQEQFHSARGLVKAFREARLSIPAVVRLGGNQEDLAVNILTTYTADLPEPAEGYKKTETPEFCAERLRQRLAEKKKKAAPPPKPPAEPFTPDGGFDTLTGRVAWESRRCQGCAGKVCVPACTYKVLKIENGAPALAIGAAEAQKGKCTECLACELECHFHGQGGLHIDLPIEGLAEYQRQEKG